MLKALKTKWSPPVRSFLIHENKVTIIQLNYGSDISIVFSCYRELIAGNPDAINYGHIWDCRHWSGLIFDHQFIGHIAWCHQFRRRQGLETKRSAPAVILAKSQFGSQLVALELSKLRGAQVQILDSIEKAWDAMETGEPMPKSI